MPKSTLFYFKTIAFPAQSHIAKHILSCLLDADAAARQPTNHKLLLLIRLSNFAQKWTWTWPKEIELLFIIIFQLETNYCVRMTIALFEIIFECHVKVREGERG